MDNFTEELTALYNLGFKHGVEYGNLQAEQLLKEIKQLEDLIKSKHLALD